jgi:hypothetical protein
LRAAFTMAGSNPHGEAYEMSIAAPAGFDKIAKLDTASICKVACLFLASVARRVRLDADRCSVLSLMRNA